MREKRVDVTLKTVVGSSAKIENREKGERSQLAIPGQQFLSLSKHNLARVSLDV